MTSDELHALPVLAKGDKVAYRFYDFSGREVVGYTDKDGISWRIEYELDGGPYKRLVGNVSPD